MNAIKKHLADTAKKGFETFKVDMPKLCEMMGDHHFSITDADDEQIEFEVGNYPFSLTWSEGKRRSIGRKVPIVLFQLIVWGQTAGGRWHPPEWIDTQLSENQGVSDLMREVFLFLAREKINGCMENLAYEEMAKEEEW